MEWECAEMESILSAFEQTVLCEGMLHFAGTRAGADICFVGWDKIGIVSRCDTKDFCNWSINFEIWSLDRQVLLDQRKTTEKKAAEISWIMEIPYVLPIKFAERFEGVGCNQAAKFYKQEMVFEKGKELNVELLSICCEDCPREIYAGEDDCNANYLSGSIYTVAVASCMGWQRMDIPKKAFDIPRRADMDKRATDWLRYKLDRQNIGKKCWIKFDKDTDYTYYTEDGCWERNELYSVSYDMSFKAGEAVEAVIFSESAVDVDIWLWHECLDGNAYGIKKSSFHLLTEKQVAEEQTKIEDQKRIGIAGSIGKTIDKVAC